LLANGKDRRRSWQGKEKKSQPPDRLRKEKASPEKRKEIQIQALEGDVKGEELDASKKKNLG